MIDVWVSKDKQRAVDFREVTAYWFRPRHAHSDFMEPDTITLYLPGGRFELRDEEARQVFDQMKERFKGGVI